MILVDDGLATGFTARAAIEVVRRPALDASSWRSRWRPRRPSSNFERRGEAIGLETPDHFFGIGQFYLDFAQTSDEEVEALLASPATAFPRTDAGGGPAHQR